MDTATKQALEAYRGNLKSDLAACDAQHNKLKGDLAACETLLGAPVTKTRGKGKRAKTANAEWLQRGQTFKAERERMGFTQKQAADAIAKSRVHVGKIETGRAQLSASQSEAWRVACAGVFAAREASTDGQASEASTGASA